jgi:hypothetical protein
MTSTHLPRPDAHPIRASAQKWAARIGGFAFTIVELCALGALLGALLFPLVGKLSGSEKNHAELVFLGVKTGGFYFMVWAPGAALVRQFIRAARPQNPLSRRAEEFTDGRK